MAYDSATPAASERWADYEVVTVDASAVCSAGAETTDARLHVQMRVTELDLVTVRVEDVSVGESFELFPWQPGQLAVGDRAYRNPPGIRAVVERGADVLVRLNRGTLPLCKPSREPFELVAWLRGLVSNRPSETDVVIRDKKGKLTDVEFRLVGLYDGGEELPRASDRAELILAKPASARPLARWRRVGTGAPSQTRVGSGA